MTDLRFRRCPTSPRRPAWAWSRATAIATVFLAGSPAARAPGLAAQLVIELPADDRSLEAGFEEVYRVGSISGDGWEVFGRVSAVGFGQSGDLYVMDDQGGRIVVVSQTGEFVREFGRIGDGPALTPMLVSGGIT